MRVWLCCQWPEWVAFVFFGVAFGLANTGHVEPILSPISIAKWVPLIIGLQFHDLHQKRSR